MSSVVIGFWPGKALLSKNVEKPFWLQGEWDLLQGCYIRRDHYYLHIGKSLKITNDTELRMRMRLRIRISMWRVMRMTMRTMGCG